MELQAGLNSLNGFDYTVLGILFLCGILALVRGFVREVLSLAALTGAFYVAARFYPKAEPFVHRYIHEHKMLTIASCLGVFCASWLIFTIIGWIIARYLVQGRALTLIDRSLGFGFGLVRGALVLCIVYMAAMAVLWPDFEKRGPEPVTEQAQLPPPVQTDQKQAKAEDDGPPPWLLKAKTRPALEYGAHALKSLIPSGEIEKTLAQYLEQKKSAQRQIDDQMLEILSTPKPDSGKVVSNPTYDDKSRDGLNHLVDQKANP